ncbi:MAG: alpha/beta hydrolase-fold protein [Limisphaerales bacterium]|jgi:predicted peptidase|nr:alpha/beta hydrolase-fold protein [Verrucomicrobiota bacterium]
MKTFVSIIYGLSALAAVMALAFIPVAQVQAAEQSSQKLGAPVPGKQVAQSTGSLNYLLFLPESYSQETSQPDAAKKWPVLVFLHGLGERGDSLSDLAKLKMHGPPMLVEKNSKFEFIAVSPQCPTDSWWPWKLEELNGMLEQVLKDVKDADPTRVYLTGLSMGGFGSFSWAIRNPERFAAVAPICGGGTYHEAWGLPNKKAAQLRSLPFWIFHGAADSVVSSELSREMRNGLQAFGVKELNLTIYPGVDHNSWTQTYDNPELYRWFLKHSR